MTDPRSPEEQEEEGALAPDEPVEGADDLPAEVREGDTSEATEEGTEGPSEEEV